jgi:hypothetical protein
VSGWIEVAHQMPGRTRLRAPALRRDEPACERLAEALAGVAGVRAVHVRPYTGSAVIEHDESVLAQSLTECASRTLGIERVLAPGEQPPLDAQAPPLASLARKIAGVVSELDRDLRRVSAGSVDLGTLATLGFIGAGAAQVATSGTLPMPPWFNLAWWGFRTFMTTERAEIDAVDE